MKPPTPPWLDIDAMIDDPRTRIIVCCGSGGVGKTTTAAAVGVRAAERGRDVVVLTVDPARRLAQSLGLSELDNSPRRIAGVGEAAGGELHAMMLDMKRTFDEIVEAHAEPERARQILANPFYQSGSWDLIVVDTPPSRSALDFLDAPERMGRFLDGRFIRVLMAPARASGRLGMKVVTAGFGVFTGVLTKVLGGQVLKDVQTFVLALDTMFGGFRERADQTYRLLQTPGTAFLVVAAPEPDALREASYFVDRLAEERMPLAGLIVNRVHRIDGATLSDGLSQSRSLAAAETLDERNDHRLTAALLRLHAERMQVVARETRLRDHFCSAHPSVPVADVGALAEDVHDMNGLQRVAADLVTPPATSGAA